MSRLAALVVLVATICLVQGQAATTANSVAPATSSLLVVNTPSVTHSMMANNASTRNTPSVAPTKVVPRVTTSVKPTATPAPNRTASTAYLYRLMDEENENLTCLLMKADISVNLTYSTSQNTSKTVLVHFVKDGKNEGVINTELTSVCFVNNGHNPHPNATLNLEYVTKSPVRSYYVNFTFAAIIDPGNQQWFSTGMAVSFTFRDEDFPDYYPESDKPEDKSELFSDTSNSLFDESFQRMELTRPYYCNSSTTVGGFSNVTTNNSLTVSLLIRQLEVQAFNFPNGRNFTPGNAARVCLSDGGAKGNTIVPIAVGAALALLVIIVIIAYLIGKVRNKRKSSYEPLN